MEEILKSLPEYGFAGIMIALLAWYILHRDKAHREERKELSDNLRRESELGREALANNTTVLSEIRTLIQSRK